MDWSGNKVKRVFFDFFEQRGHKIVPSAPMVLKDDPTLMFTNAGMNQFKDIFLSHEKSRYPRLADAQKCLRVSGKHNDLEEVGVDTYHHTMFEMLGNWSFGDYFKQEAIEWAWELLTAIYGIGADHLFVTVFGGNKEEGLAYDQEAVACWKKHIPQDRILSFGKKENFWEMGETGPCGPCSEIHIDLRTKEEREKTNGAELINTGHPLVIEIWNLVFIEFNRSKNGLKHLPQKHVDTGMGFERLCMVLQDKRSNYDTDIFHPLISRIEEITGIKKGTEERSDIAIRVIADHVRAVAFAIAEGQLPSNAKAGYVIRRILRRAIRYGYSFLKMHQPFICELIPVLSAQMGDFYPELKKRETLMGKVVREEEENFLRTLANGMEKLSGHIHKGTASGKKRVIPGRLAFELYDTYGFPVDLTRLISHENKWEVDMDGFNKCLSEQKNRSKNAVAVSAGEWTVLIDDDVEEFVGYDYTETKVRITKYRTVKVKGRSMYHLVFNITPFYAEGGGQVGDTGYIASGRDRIDVLNTFRENRLIIHLTSELPSDLDADFKAVVDARKRMDTARNHSATHLLHRSLQEVLGEHVEQKGSLVNADHLRFDFVHFRKMSKEEIRHVEQRVNEMIRANMPREENRHTPFQQAMDMGAIALFGEKYGDLVRVIRFGESVELCGGIHVESTGQIGLFRIISESAIAAGIRRIEAITGSKAQQYVDDMLKELEEVKSLLKNPGNLLQSVQELLRENAALNKLLQASKKKDAESLKEDLLHKMRNIHGVNFIAEKVHADNEIVRDIAFRLRKEVDNLFLVLAIEINGKAMITVALSDKLIGERGYHAGNIVRELASKLRGGGGGQAFFATAGGKYVEGIDAALSKAEKLIG